MKFIKMDRNIAGNIIYFKLEFLVQWLLLTISLIIMEGSL